MTSDFSIEIVDDTNVPTSYCALFLTAIPVEFNAICEHLENIESVQHPKGNFYNIGKISFNGIEWKVCVGQTGPHNTAAAVDTERAIDYCKPHIAFFVGVAGGLKDVQLGDVVVSSKIYSYESAKIKEGYKPRFEIHTPPYPLRQLAEKLTKESGWIKRIKPNPPKTIPKVIVGPIVSGEKLLSDRESYEYKLIEQNCSDALAAEMEGFGFLEATYRNSLHALVFRGISDYCDKDKGKADEGGSQEIASAHASAFAIEFLASYSESRVQNKQETSSHHRPQEDPSTSHIERDPTEQTQYDPIDVPIQQKSSVTLNSTDSSEDTPNKQEIDEIKKLLDSYRPDKALIAIAHFKEKKWSIALNIEKYRVIGNEGLAEIQLTNYKKGGSCLIDALEYNPDDEKALANASYGYLLIAEFERAIKCTEKIIASNPNNTGAYSIYIQSKAHFDSIEKIISTIPESVKNTLDVASAIGQCYFNAGNFYEAAKWFEISVREANKDALFLKAMYASSILNKVKNNPRSLSGIQITAEMHQDLERSRAIFDEVIQSISDNISMQKAHFSWFIERGIVNRLMGLKSESSKDFNKAYVLNSTNPAAIYHKGLTDYEEGDPREAEIQSEKILWDESSEGALWLYLSSLRSQKKYDEGIVKISEFEQKSLSDDQKNLLYQFLITFYLDKGEQFYVNAESIAKTRYESDKNDILKLIQLLRTYQITKNLKDLEIIIEEIQSRDFSNIPDLQQIEIADIFYDVKHPLEASKIYSRLVDPSENTGLTQKLIASHFFSNNHKSALEYCKILHSRHGPQPYSSKIELAIYLEVGDLQEAKKICVQYLEKYPKDYEMKLNKAKVDFRANNISEVNSFLEVPYKLSELSYESGTKLASLFFAVSRFDDAIKVSYAVRNKFPDNPQAHLDYIQIILDVADRSSLLNKPEKVQLDTVVQLEDPFKVNTSYFICLEGSTDPLFITKLSPSTVLGGKIINASEGVKISFEAPVGENFVIVKNILSKYIFAFQESVNNFSQKFLGHPGIFKIPVGSGNDGHITKDDIQNLRTLVEKNQKNVDTLLNLYKKRRFTISGVAQALNRDIFTVSSIISQNNDTGILCCYQCTSQESEDAKRSLDGPVRLVIDPIALYTIYSDTKFGNLIVKKYGKLIISQSTVDLLRGSIINLTGISSQRHLSLTTIGDAITGYEITTEQIAAVKQHYEQFLSWVEQNCEIHPCYESLAIDPNKKQEYQSLFGQATLDSMLLASHENTLLYSDDGLVQGVAKELYNVKSVWSQILRIKIEIENKESTEILEETAIKLLQQHHFPPIINGLILFNAAKKARWDYGSPFTEVVQLLQDIRLAPAISVTTGAEFVIRLWIERIDSDSRNYLILIVLKAITQNREKTLLCRAFMACIQNSTELFDFEKTEIINLIIFYHDFLL